MEVLTSTQDASVNFVLDSGQEARYVARPDADYVTVYLSSHNGCNQACRFCHLTQTGQTRMDAATVNEMIHQAEVVLRHYQTAGGRTKVHFNWMARGEPLLNPYLRNNWRILVDELTYMSQTLRLAPVFNLSTIMPLTLDDPYLTWLTTKNTTVYYSLYSMDREWRKRWLPKAMLPEAAIGYLSAWQADTGNDVVIHFALIDGENDSEANMNDIAEAVSRTRLRARFNLVRYNPYSTGQGQESSEQVIEQRFKTLALTMKIQGSRIVPRVGFDVKASCGMFVEK